MWALKNWSYILIFSAFLISTVKAEDTSTIAIDTASPLEFPLNITLNKEDKGVFFVFMDDGNLLIKVDNLKEIGIVKPEGSVTLIDSMEYLSLKSMTGIDFTFNEKDISLEITADPRLFQKNILTMRYPRRSDVIFTEDSSAFLNYNATYSAEDPFDFSSFTLTDQLGVRVKDMLLLSDFAYTKNPDSERFVRLMSNITYDDRERLNTIIFGDFYGSSGELGSTLNMGGISFSKNYMIDPYFIRYSEIGFTGLVSLPSEAEIYRNGILINRERLSPGEFELRDIPVDTGLGTVEVVLRDPFGRKQTITQPYYFTNRLLKKGIQEFSYNIGYLRKDFGIKHFSYGEAGVSGFHRFGMSDSFTASMRSEATKDVFNLGAGASYLLHLYGSLDASAAISRSRERGSGIAASIGYSYQSRTFSGRLLLRGYTENYSNIALESAKEKTRFQMSAAIGYNMGRFGSATFETTGIKKYQGMDTKRFSVIYSKGIAKSAGLFATFRETKDVETTDEYFVGLNYYFGRSTSGSLSYQNRDGKSTEFAQVQKSPPPGDGLGYRASFERSETQIDAIDTYNTSLQYNGRYGIYRGEYSKTGGNEGYSASASGSIVLIGNSLNFSRPISDSYALVKVGDLKGVTVYYSNQRVGRTDGSGKILIPNLLSFNDNKISINDRDIPINYAISNVDRYISPPYRSGAFIKFGVTKIQGITGRLNAKVDEGIKPVEYYDVKLFLKDKELTFPTGRDGEFYLENIKPGKYRAVVNYEGRDCFFGIIIPESEEMLIDLGEMTCE